jgi:hypothetical protein
VSPSSQPAMPPCNHERRPGTAVCLHCRHAAIEAAKARRKKVMLRGAAVGVVLAVVGAAGALSANAIAGRIEARREARNASLVVASSEPAKETKDTSVSAVPVTLQGEVAAASAMRAPLTPVIPQGETMLRDSVLATRSDSAVLVTFDRSMMRTRIPMKFELFLRATLPQVYGLSVDSLLKTIPEGAIAAQCDLINELPSRGIIIPLKDVWAIQVLPETRPGQDGPLVVRYRTAVVIRN